MLGSSNSRFQASLAVTMKVNFSITVIALLLPFLLFSQQNLSKEQVAEDYAIFKTILTTGHPALYEYTSKEEWELLFKNFEAKSIANSDSFFTAISALANAAKDGHLSVLHPKMDPIPPLFPLLLKIIDGKLYTDTDDFGLPLGSEIVSIEGVSGQVILQTLLKYAPSDGYNISKKYRQVEREFGILHFYEYGSSTSYTVKYLNPDGEVHSTALNPASFESIGKRHCYRNSHYAAYHQKPKGPEYFKARIAEKWPSVYFIDSLSTAVLTVNSFGLDPTEFKSRLIALFKDIKKNKASHLIIDIRQNNGGYRANAISLFSFLASEPFKQRISESAITNVLPEKEHLVHTISDYEDFFEMYFPDATKENDRWWLKEDHAQAEMTPFKKTYNGTVHVLIGGNTFSAGTAFALSAKNDEAITLVGEETGGGYYFHSGQYLCLYKLPNSGIMLRVPFVKIDKYVRDHTVPKGAGILPDAEANLTVQDLIAGRDPQLHYVLTAIGVE